MIGEWAFWLFVQQSAWIVGAISLTMTYLMGDKKWWAPLLGLFGQVFWAILAVYTHQYGLMVTVGLYTFIHSRNALKWWRLHKAGRLA
jgi:hypothetical protein